MSTKPQQAPTSGIGPDPQQIRAELNAIFDLLDWHLGIVAGDKLSKPGREALTGARDAFATLREMAVPMLELAAQLIAESDGEKDSTS